jgi:hypothetical protein
MKLSFGVLYSRFLLLCFVCLALGCGDNQIASDFKNMNKLSMQKLVNSYVMFASVNGNVGPKDSDELFNFIRTDERVAPRLGMSSGDLDTLEDLLISDADGEPFEIRYGLKIRVDEDKSPIVFDKTGVDGMRRVALADNRILEVTSSKKYDRMLSGNVSAKDTAIDESQMDVAE